MVQDRRRPAASMTTVGDVDDNDERHLPSHVQLHRRGTPSKPRPAAATRGAPKPNLTTMIMTIMTILIYANIATTKKRWFLRSWRQKPQTSQRQKTVVHANTDLARTVVLALVAHGEHLYTVTLHTERAVNYTTRQQCTMHLLCILASGCWLLAAGCWMLAALCWLLAVGSIDL